MDQKYVCRKCNGTGKDSDFSFYATSPAKYRKDPCSGEERLVKGEDGRCYPAPCRDCNGTGIKLHLVLDTLAEKGLI